MKPQFDTQTIEAMTQQLLGGETDGKLHRTGEAIVFQREEKQVPAGGGGVISAIPLQATGGMGQGWLAPAAALPFHMMTGNQ